MIDIDALRRNAAGQPEEPRKVSVRWLRAVLSELEAARAGGAQKLKQAGASHAAH